MALIDTNDLKARLREIPGYMDDDNVTLIPLREVQNVVDMTPTVEADPVVRCKDCLYWRREVNTHTHWVCTQHSFNERLMHTTPDFYCADGKRRANDG